MKRRIHVFYVGLDEFCTERNESAAMENESETQNDESGTNNGVFRNLFIYCGAGFISHCCGHVTKNKLLVFMKWIRDNKKWILTQISDIYVADSYLYVRIHYMTMRIHCRILRIHWKVSRTYGKHMNTPSGNMNPCWKVLFALTLEVSKKGNLPFFWAKVADSW